MSPANYPADLADRLFAFETGELDEKETLQFFADLELARIGSLHFITCRFSERLNGLLITR